MCNYICQVPISLYYFLFSKKPSVIFNMGLCDRTLCFIVLSFQIENFNLLCQESGEIHPSSSVGSLQFPNAIFTLHATIDFLLDIYIDAHTECRVVDTCAWIFASILWKAGNRMFLLVENGNNRLIFQRGNEKYKQPTCMVKHGGAGLSQCEKALKKNGFKWKLTQYWEGGSMEEKSLRRKDFLEDHHEEAEMGWDLPWNWSSDLHHRATILTCRDEKDGTLLLDRETNP